MLGYNSPGLCTHTHTPLQSFIVYKRSKLLGRRDEVMLNIDGDKLSVIPYAPASTSFRKKEPKLVSYMMELLVFCCLLPEKSALAFKLVVCVFPSSYY